MVPLATTHADNLVCLGIIALVNEVTTIVLGDWTDAPVAAAYLRFIIGSLIHDKILATHFAVVTLHLLLL